MGLSAGQGQVAAFNISYFTAVRRSAPSALKKTTEALREHYSHTNSIASDMAKTVTLRAPLAEGNRVLCLTSTRKVTAIVSEDLRVSQGRAHSQQHTQSPVTISCAP